MGRPKGSKNKPKPKVSPEEQLKKVPKLVRTASAVRDDRNEVKYRNDGMRQQGGWKKPYKVMQGDELHATIELAMQTLDNWHDGVQRSYPPTPEGLDLFIARSSAYLHYIDEENQKLVDSPKLIPDVESWCVYCGITRRQLYQFKERKSGDWENFIGYFMEVIASAKKQLALNGNIPSVIAMFDMVNNHDYHNTSEYKITNKLEAEKPQLTAEQLIEKSKQLPGFSAETSLLEEKRIPNDIFDRPIIDGEYVTIEDDEESERGDEKNED